jgi:hypothetical protein
VLDRVLWVKTHPTRPKIPSGLGRDLPIKPDPARDRVRLGFVFKTHLAGWVISGWVVGSGWVVRTLIKRGVFEFVKAIEIPAGTRIFNS